MKLEVLLPLIKGDYEVYCGNEYIDEYKENESIVLDSKYNTLRNKEVVSISCSENRNASKNILSIVVE